jgi:hypothetical protein
MSTLKKTHMPTNVSESFESNVRSYSRSYPVMFKKGRGAYLYTDKGQGYIDFLKMILEDEDSCVGKPLTFEDDVLDGGFEKLMRILFFLPPETINTRIN